MALTVNRKETPVSDNIATERLYLTEDKTKVVGEDDPEARFLLAGEGSEIPDEYAELVAGRKAKKAPANKAADQPANKAAGA